MVPGEVQSKARFLGLDPEGLTTSELIHLIQTREGFDPCYGRKPDCQRRCVCCFASHCTRIKIHRFEVI